MPNKILLLVSSAVFSKTAQGNCKNIGVNGPEIRTREFLKYILPISQSSFYLLYGSGVLVNNFKDLSARFPKLSLTFTRNGSIYLIFPAFFWLCLFQRFRVVHSQGPISYDILNIFFSLVFKYKAIVTRPVVYKDEVALSAISRFLVFVDRLLLPFAFKVICISDYHYRYLLSDYKLSNLFLIKNGASSAKFNVSNKLRSVPTSFSASSPLTISFLAQFTRVKLQALLLDALVLIPPHIHIEVYFIGDGPLFSECVEYYNSISLSASVRVKFVGYTPNPENYLSASQVSCLLSLREGLPVSLIESLHASCALISSNVGATSELCCSSNGLLVDDHDPQIISDFLISIYNDPFLLRSFMAHSSEIAHKYSLESMCTSYYQIYNS
tara:strand:+ start:16116 stop:17264 length:1149 start_codon:yes stop_codon:yes gene_type:complete